MPRFYVNVFFHALPPGSAYLGGEPADDFVRVTIDHIARAMDNDAEQQQFLAACTRILQPYIAAHGLRWELHVDETPFSLWTIDGLKPPAPGTTAGEKWRSENRPSVWEGDGLSLGISGQKIHAEAWILRFRQPRETLREGIRR